MITSKKILAAVVLFVLLLIGVFKGVEPTYSIFEIYVGYKMYTYLKHLKK